jgi:hypothetical protein
MLGLLVKRTVLTAPPVGKVFHNKAQRIAYIQWQAREEAGRKQQMEYNMQKSAHDQCRNSGGQDCHPPLAVPPR